MAPHEPQIYQQLIFKDGDQIKTLNAQTVEEARAILEHIHANGYDLIAIEGWSWIIPKLTERSLGNER